MTSALVVAGAALSGGESLAEAQPPREFYQLRKYSLKTGPQLALTQNYFEQALIPALNRMAIAPIGAFRLDIGPETPAYYVLIPSASAEALVTLDTKLAEDAEFIKAAAAFCGGPGRSSGVCARRQVRCWSGICRVAQDHCSKDLKDRLETNLSVANLPKAPPDAADIRKVQMFNEAEINIFVRTGLTPVFFGDTLIGPRMPSLTYMLTFADTAELDERWKAFVSDPAWKELSGRPQYADAEIVSNISNLHLSPLDCSQI